MRIGVSKKTPGAPGSAEEKPLGYERVRSSVNARSDDSPWRRAGRVLGKVTLDWQFEWPLLYNNGTLTEIKRNDVFVQDGGGVSYSDRHSLFYVSFTYLNSTSPEGKFGYIFEVNNDGSVRSKLEVPRVLWESLLSGMYRAVPYDSIFGESNANPFNATASDVDGQLGRV